MKRVAQKPNLSQYFIGISKDSLIYGLGNSVLRILALMTAPIFTRIFTPSDYGIISLISSIMSFVNLFLIFGIDQALFVSYYEHKKERKDVVSSALWFVLSWGLIIITFGVIFSRGISNLIFDNPNQANILAIALINSYIILAITIAKAVFRLEFKARTFAFVSAFNALIATGLMILLVVKYHLGIMGYFAGLLIGTFLSALLGIYFIRKSIKFKITFVRLKEMVKFGSMIVPTSLSFFIFDLSDRFFLNHYRDLSEIGLYSIAINIASILTFFSFALGQAWSPQIMNIYFNKRKIYFHLVPKFLIYYLLFFLSLAVGLSIFNYEILRIFTTPKFFGASTVVPILALAMVFSASNQFTALGVTISKKTKYLAISTALAAGINIIFNFLLIPKYGMLGAGYSTAISYLFLTISYFFNSQKFVPLKLDWQKILKMILLGLVFIFFSPRFWNYTYPINLAIKISEFSLFFVSCYLFQIIEKSELTNLGNYLKKFLKIAK
ncbi:MAG: Polysaccharide biosynthesis protein [Candidatus Berkelbacteria bacterium]|nr:Polysaccharide biosynthesis protein [Candidatus Berkelbacteria bacterium]